MLAAILRWTLAGARLQVAARQDVNTQSADILAEPRRPLRIIKSSPLARRTRNVLPFAKTTCLLTGGWTATLEVVVARRCAKTKSVTFHLPRARRTSNVLPFVKPSILTGGWPATLEVVATKRCAKTKSATFHLPRPLASIQAARRASLKPERHGAGMSWGVSRARLMM